MLLVHPTPHVSPNMPTYLCNSLKTLNVIVVNAYPNLIILNVIHCFNIICLYVCIQNIMATASGDWKQKRQLPDISPG